MDHKDLLTKLLADPGQAGVYRLPRAGRAVVKAAAEQSGLACFEISLADCTRIEAVLAKIGHDLDFPAWFGHNFDALNDCLSDFSWAEAPGYVLLIAGAEGLQAEDPAAFAILNAVFAAVIAEYQERHRPMWVLYDFGGDGLKTFPAVI